MSVQVLDYAALARSLAVRDLSDPAQGEHAVQLLVQVAARTLSAAWKCDARVVRSGPIVAVADNYDALGYDRGAIARDSRYTRYVSTTCMLRSHSSAMVPPALRDLARAPDPPRDVLLVCPGMCYRRDLIDRIHTGMPHQLDLWRIAARPLGEGDLDEMIATVVASLLPGALVRTEPAEHPYTDSGCEINASVDGGDSWVEIGECGLAAPDVLRGAGLPEGTTGLAMGLGLDRLLMLRKGAPDIRLLRSADDRIASQMLDLAQYRPVSNQPPIVRDISIAVDAEADAELLGDRVRAGLGSGGDVVEEVTVLSSTRAEDLPEGAAARLGIRPGQQNLLVRVVLRSVDRTLSDSEANDLRDRIYALLHRGGRHLWAASSRK